MLHPVRRGADRAASGDAAPFAGANLLIGFEELLLAVHTLELDESVSAFGVISALFDGLFDLFH